MSEIDSDENKYPILSGEYFKLDDALDEVKDNFQCGDTIDKVSSTAKLVGKTVFNVGLFAGKLGVDFIKAMPAQIAKNAKDQLQNNKNLTDEQRIKLEEAIEKYDKKSSDDA